MMREFYGIIATFILVHVSVVPTIAHAVPQPPTIEQISASPFILRANVSPNGDFFAAKLANDPFASFGVYDRRGGGLVPLIEAQENDELFIEWFRWINDDTLLVRMGRRGGVTAQVRVDGKYERYSTAYGTSLYIFNAAAQSAKEKKPLWLLTQDGSMVSNLDHDPDHVLIQKANSGGPTAVYRVNIREDKKWERVQPMKRSIYRWRADRTGEPRIGFGTKNNGDRVVIAKLKGSDEFLDLSHFVDDVDKRFEPSAFAEDLNHIYVFSNHQTDTQALYLFDLETGQFLEQLYHNPSFDVSGIWVDSKTGKLQRISYFDSENRNIWFDGNLKTELAGIGVQFPDHNVDVISLSDNALFGIVHINSPSDPGQYFIFDRVANALSALPVQYPNIPVEVFGKQFFAEYASHDGLKIPAFVTLPSGFNNLSQARQLPFVIFPHGGPAARDFAEFDMWTQFFAMHGYGVLQMNFRGSTGYGLTFEKAGRQQWGKLMQDDISDGVRWLIDENIADPQRIAIAGASYGGYAALMGAVKSPELFQCAVSFAGVSDLFELVEDSDPDSYVRRLIGDRFSQADDLRENSPQRRIDDFGVPVLLLHGRLDGVVGYGQSKKLYERMRRAKKPVEFVTMPQSGHSIYHDYTDRKLFFAEQKKFLEGCLGKAY